MEQPQVSTRPEAKPARMPPTMQLVRRSGMTGVDGEGMTARKTELQTVQIAAFQKNSRPRAL